MPVYACVLIALGAIVLAVLCKMLLSAVLATRKRRTSDSPRKNVSAEKNAEYARTLQEMIRCQTVSAPGNELEFAKLREVLKNRFPLLHERAELTVFGSGCLVFRIAGRDAKKNIMLMSHHDVVAAVEEDWKYPPFSGTIAEGALWGRGAVDTKTPFFAELQSAEELLAEGWDFPGINLYLGSSDNEEVCGDGIPLAVAYFKEHGVHFDFVSDEGGAITTGMMPGVSKKSAMVAVHEKGRHTFTCRAKDENQGHVGLNPATSNPVSRMAEFIAEVNRAGLFRPKFYPEVEATFRAHAPYMSFPYRMLFSNFGFFRRLLLSVLPKVSGQVGSMLKTTMQFTAIAGGKREQVLSKEVTATAFFRCVRESDLERELERFRAIAAKHRIEIEPGIRDYCRPSSAEQEQYRMLERVLNRTAPDVIVSPFLLTAGSDSRHFSEIADCILRFAPIDLNCQQYASIHNVNENISLENIGECVCFYREWILEACE